MYHKQRWAAALTAAVLLSGMTSLVSHADDSLLHSADFEGGTNGWSSFGSSSVSFTNNDKHAGDSCLYVAGRTDSWNGASCEMGSILTGGRSYNFSAWVNGKEGDTVQFMLKYTDGEGEQYKEIGSAAVGSWTQISGSYDIPNDATGILVYFQTAEGTNDFMVDDVTIKGQASWSEQALLETPLKDVYANYFKIGCAATPAELTPPIAQDIVKRHFNSLTVGNELKPDYVLDKAATQASGKLSVSLVQASSILKFCEENHIPVRGHVFCWYSQTPSWFFREDFSDQGAYVSKDVMNQRLDEYIKAVFEAISTQYPELDVYCWDVVNECYLDNGQLREGGSNITDGQSEWTLIYGDNSYIEQAFTSARKYAPEGTKLFYNDYNEYIPAKRDAIYDMAKKLAEKNLIDGVGMQSHLDVGYPDAALYRQAIDKFDSLGLEVQITELDITDYNGGADSVSVARAYKSIMEQIVDAKKSGANITACVFWGITDGTSWRSDGYPLLLNADYSPKTAYYAVQDVIPKEEWADTDNPPEPPDGLFHAQKGDVYTDGSVDFLDIIQMQKYLHLGTPNAAVPGKNMDFPAELIADDPWDLNDDGTCDVYDLALLKRMFLNSV